jgi:hypothetical protein
MTNVAAAPYTWDDFVALDEDDLRELIDGELVEVEVPTGRHEDIVMLLGHFLTAWAEQGHGGRARGSGYKLRVSARRGAASCPTCSSTGATTRLRATRTRASCAAGPTW